MEGLIPLVYKAIKRKKAQNQYKCLSMGATQTYNIGDFYTSTKFLTPPPDEKSTEAAVDDGGQLHRRYKSVGDFELTSSAVYTTTNMFYSPDMRTITEIDSQPRLSKQVVSLGRRRSHRGMFSCVTGAA